MKRWKLALLVVSVSLGFVAGSARGQPTGDVLEMRAQRINALVPRRGGMSQALRIVSSQTGLPVPRLQTMLSRAPNAGAAGLLIACALGDKKGKPPEQFFSRHASGKKWSTIARDNRVSINTINLQLDKLESSLNRLPPTGRPDPPPPPLGGPPPVPPRPMY